MSERISACLIACNEADQLPRCLDALAFVDEVVVVVDAKSTDETEAIARKRADRVEVRVYAGDIEQKRGCVALATHAWALIVDPDEVVSKELARSIRAQVEAAPPARAGFELNRRTHHLGRWIRHGDFYPDWKLRLFRRERAHWVGADPHGRIEVEGGVERIDAPLAHYSYRDLAEQVERIQFFSSEAARSLDEAGRRFRLRDLVLRPPARFLRAYLLKAGFRDGIPGFVIAGATAFHVFLKYAKLWERQRPGAGR
jgi:glycosyltransferase involved in cell wall biosynthesis